MQFTTLSSMSPAQRIIRGGWAIHLSVITFVLIHGSWHDGSAWRDIIRRLESHGHKAFGPTVAGHGKDMCKQVSHAQSTQSIADFIISPPDIVAPHCRSLTCVENQRP
jgi:hypothetical protein